MRDPSPSRPTLPVWLLFLANYAVALALCARFLPAASASGKTVDLFLLGVALSYPALYLAPALALSLGLACAAGRRRRAAWLVLAVAPLAFAAVQLFLYADLRVHEVFGFHVNSFVWNLLVTPGGFESMGSGTDSQRSAGLIVLGALGAEGALLFTLLRLQGRRPARALGSRVFVSAFAGALLLLGLGERALYGLAGVTGDAQVLQLADALPFYQPTSIDALAEWLGFEVKRTQVLPLQREGARLAYPLHPVVLPADGPRPNLLVLCAESLRADALDPELMPATWRLAERSSRFTRHLSSGNGTRMGVFGLFYGLPGSYWFPFLDRHQPPVLLSALAGAGYGIEAFTADKFSYPEMDQTAFAGLSKAHLHEAARHGAPKRPSWQRDREQVSKLIDFMERHDRSRPFFAYLFFESPHARYEFPPESVIRRPYLESFDYVTTDLARDMPLIRNRYLNSVHHLDSQIARVLEYLETSGLAESTVVLVTGDHGEEFLEKGRWGHNSAFSEEQIRVPFVLHVPGRAPEVVERMTSHLDVPATLLGLAGAASPPSDYSLGSSLLGPELRRWALVSDWGRMLYVDDGGKASFPMSLSAFFRQELVDRQDQPVADREAFMQARLPALHELMGELGRFSRPPPLRAAVHGAAPPAS